MKNERTPLATYWTIIIIWYLAALALYGRHLVTGFTPDRAAVHIDALDFDVFWYGIWIVGGIALGAYVISTLAGERARKIFSKHVPDKLKKMPLSKLDFPKDIQAHFTKNRFGTLGLLLFVWGFEPRELGLKKEQLSIVRTRLEAVPGVKPEWLEDAPWRIWNPEHVWSGIIWCLILGVIGARLYHVLTPSPSMAAVGIHSPLDYFRNPYQIINFRNGGLGLYGGIAGGALGLWIFTRRQRIPTIAWMDMAVIGLPLGQVFGRWGNFFNQELYGRPTNAFWAVQIDPPFRLPDYSNITHFHPAFLYESLWSLLTFLVLHTLYKRYGGKLRTGELTALYFIFYGIGRSLLETVRLDSRLVEIGSLQLNMAIATLVSLIIAALMAGWIVYGRFLKKRLKGGDI